MPGERFSEPFVPELTAAAPPLWPQMAIQMLNIGCLTLADSTGFGVLSNNSAGVSGCVTGIGRDGRGTVYVVSPGASLIAAGNRTGQRPILEFFAENLVWQATIA